MRQSKSTSGERTIKDIKRKTRKQYSAEESERSAIGSRNSEPASCWMVCAARTVSLSCVAKKASLKAFIISGRRTLWVKGPPR